MSKYLPKRCLTCGGKGWYSQPDHPGAEPTKQTCTDCIDGTTGFLVFEGEGDE